MNNSFLEVLKISSFRKIWGSQILSQTAINIVNFAIILRVFEGTKSTVAVSLVWTFYAIPAIILGPFSGALVDLLSRRKILIITNLLEGVIILFYLLVKAKLWPIYSVIFLYSLVNQLYIPAEASTLPAVVSKKLLPIANSLFLFTLYGSFLAGFGLSGPIIRIIGREAPFVLGAVLLGIASFLVYRLPKEEKIEQNQVRGFQEFFEQAKEGLLFIRNTQSILFPVLLLVFAQVIVGIISILAPSIATDILSLSLLDAGPIIVLPAGVGALIGVQMVTQAIRKQVRKKKIIITGLFLTALSLIVFALVVPVMGYFKIPVALLTSLLLGASFVSIVIPVQTFIQEKTPDDFRARVYGVLGFGITIASVVPVLVTATISDVLGINFILALVGIFVGFLGFYSNKVLNGMYVNNRT